MMLITTPRRLGELGRHLMKTGRGSNEQVIIRDDLCRDVPHEALLALRVLAAQSRRNHRVQRDVVHVVISPKRALSPAELGYVLKVIEEEYGIPFDAARHVTEHRKGRRPPHFHVVYAMTDPATGKALRFRRSRERDDMLARRLEIELGEGLSPSVRVDRIAEMLRERGLEDLAERAAAGPVAERGILPGKDEMQQAGRLEADVETIDDRVLLAWRRCSGDLQRLRAELDASGFSLCAGHTLVDGRPIVRLIDRESLMTTSLTRHVNRVSKRAGQAAKLHEIDVGRVFGELPAEKQARAALRLDGPQRSADAVLGEFDRLIREMEADGERDQADRAKAAKERTANRLTAEERTRLRQRQALVRERYRRRDRIRRARVNRFFIAAGVFANPEVRKLAFYLLAAGAMATGAGLLGALAVAGVAVASLPSYQGARRLRAAHDQAAAKDRIAVAAELQAESRDFFRQRAIAMKLAEQRARQRAMQERSERAARLRAMKEQAHARAGRQDREGLRIRTKAAEEQLARVMRGHRPGRGGQGDGGQQRNRSVPARPRGRGLER